MLGGWLKNWYNTIPETAKHNAYTVFMVVLVGITSYGLGKIGMLEAERQPVQILAASDSEASTTAYVVPLKNKDEFVPKAIPEIIEKKMQASPTVDPKPTHTQDEKIIGVKSSKKYYYPWCPTLARVKESSVIVFNSIEEARKAGYVPAKNCKGLK